MARVAPYGSWRSPITSALVATGQVSLGQIHVAGHTIHWTEGRPAEGGRSVVCRLERGQVIDVTPPGFNARTRVHEYGGGAYFVHGSSVYFSNFSDQRLYRQDPGRAPRPITPEPILPAGQRYADGAVTPDGRLIICVRETHREGREAVNEIVALPVDGSAAPWPLASGFDFYSFPRVSPDGGRLAWTCWNHPQMPWDGTEVWVAAISPDWALSEVRRVAGGLEESIFQPEWSPEGILHFVSDRTGWWNLYREEHDVVRPVAPVEAELGVPQWAFGFSTYAFLGDGRTACIYGREGIRHLGLIAPGRSGIEEPSAPYTDLAYLRAIGGRLVFVGAGPVALPQVALLDPAGGPPEVLRCSLDLEVDPRFYSPARPVEFPTEGGLSAHALFYAPANPDYAAPPGELPPLLLVSHGGPTGAATSGLNLGIQYWTSRGFAVMDVNYGGSTGYGRAYRERLNGQWGVVDTADCINAARFAVDRGDVDPCRLAIRGGSAGGYTTLCALTFHDVFAAGASYFGVADAEALARDTHKFESRYLDGLIGPYPQDRDLYRDRSPIHFTDRLSCPVILFQGLEDEIVPPSQAEEMVKVLTRKGLPHAYHAFEGEQHGFRKAETIRRCLEAELHFYSRVFGFEPAPDPSAGGSR